MITFLCCVIFVLLAIIGFLSYKLYESMGNLLDLEDSISNREEYYRNFAKQSYDTLAKVHSELEKVSKYGVISDEPIVQSLVSAVKTGRDNVKNVIERYNDEIKE